MKTMFGLGFSVLVGVGCAIACEVKQKIIAAKTKVENIWDRLFIIAFHCQNFLSVAVLALVLPNELTLHHRCLEIRQFKFLISDF